MGCWNKTCGLTNLPIKDGDEVYVFILEQSPDSNHCYSNHLYSPLIKPFLARYNDYGAGDECTGYEEILEIISECVVASNNPDIDSERLQYLMGRITEKHGSSKMTPEYFFALVHDGLLYVEEPIYKEHHKIEFVMFRKDVVDHLLVNYKFDSYVGDGLGTTGYHNNYIEYTFADIINDYQEWHDVIKSKLDSSGPFRSMCYMNTRHAELENNKFAKCIRYTDNFSRIFNFDSYVFNKIEEGNDIRGFMFDCMVGIFLDFYMNQIRKSWMPMCGEGSGGQNYDHYKLLIESMQLVIQNAEDDE